MSAPKCSPHVPLKCGFRCLDCRESHLFEHKLLEKACNVNDGRLHRLVKRAVMCQHCDAMSDCLETFIKEPCTGQKHSGLVKTSSPPGPSLPDPKRIKIEKSLAEAEYEMARLVMLKGLQAERLQLQKLQVAKKQRETKDASSIVACRKYDGTVSDCGSTYLNS